MMHDFKDPYLSSNIKPLTIETDNGIIEYVDFGEGPVIVAIHGAMGGYDQSVILAQTIGDIGFRYIAITRPGYLGTPMSSGKSPEQQGDLIVTLLDKLKIEKAGVIAVSGGGPSALQFGIRHSDRCSGLVLVSTFAEEFENPIPFTFNIMKFLARYSWFVNQFHKKAKKDLVAIAKRSIRNPEILDKTVNDTETWPLFSTMLLSTYHRMNERIEGTENDIDITRTASYKLEDLSVPVLVIHGTEDQLVSFETNTKIYKARIPNVEILEVDGGEHVTIFTHRNIVKAKVSEFMSHHYNI
jgi:pimeloyl-ACP methyl ester carboxylesterase